MNNDNGAQDLAILEGEMAQTEQAKMLRNAREALGLTSEELAAELGVSLATLQSWLRPPTSEAHREMPQTAKLLLARILADKRTKKGKP